MTHLSVFIERAPTLTARPPRQRIEPPSTLRQDEGTRQWASRMRSCEEPPSASLSPVPALPAPLPVYLRGPAGARLRAGRRRVPLGDPRRRGLLLPRPTAASTFWIDL